MAQRIKKMTAGVPIEAQQLWSPTYVRGDVGLIDPWPYSVGWRSGVATGCGVGQ